MPRRLVSSVLLRTTLLGLLCTACAAGRPPELAHAVDTEWGRVHAARRADAVEVAVLVEDIAPRIAELLPAGTQAALDIRLLRKQRHAHLGGATIATHAARWIELPARGRDAAARAILAHELVHYWLGAEWSTLPPVLEEGLAILLSHAAVPEAAPEERGGLALMLALWIDGAIAFEGPRIEVVAGGRRLLDSEARYTLRSDGPLRGLPPLTAALDTSPEALVRAEDPRARAALDGLACVLVERIGVDWLRQLCVQAATLGHARIPAGWIWRAAGIDPDEPSALRAAARAMLGPTEVRALLLRDDMRLVPAAEPRG